MEPLVQRMLRHNFRNGRMCCCKEETLPHGEAKKEVVNT